MRKLIAIEPVEDDPMIKLKIRAAVKEDVPGLIRLFKETILEVYGQILPREVLKPWVEGDRLNEDVNYLWQKMIVAEKDREIVAAAARLDDLIALLWVHPSHQRKGIGSILLDAVEMEMKKIGYGAAKLECFSDNDYAMEFYRANGWEPFSEEIDKDTGVLKTVMIKTLTNA